MLKSIKNYERALSRLGEIIGNKISEKGLQDGNYILNVIR